MSKSHQPQHTVFIRDGRAITKFDGENISYIGEVGKEAVSVQQSGTRAIVTYDDGEVISYALPRTGDRRGQERLSSSRKKSQSESDIDNTCGLSAETLVALMTIGWFSIFNHNKHGFDIKFWIIEILAIFAAIICRKILLWAWYLGLLFIFVKIVIAFFSNNHH
jgi:hypothetical protein